MKRTLKYILRREAYNRTKKALRELETAVEGDGQDGDENDREGRPESRGTVGTRMRTRTRVSTPDGSAAADADLEAALQSMDDYDFEGFVADLWERLGWETTVSTQSADRGVDVVATRDVPYDQKALIQAKRYGPDTTVGSPDIQQYASLKHQRHGVDKVVVVTTNGFTGQAEELAHRLNVKLVDGGDLAALVEDLDARDLVERYVPGIREPEPESGPEPDIADPAHDAPTGDRTADPTDARSETEVGIAGTENDTDERWKWVAGATGAWILGVALAGADGGISIVLAWIALPYAILKDGGWTRWRRWYAAAALLPVVAMFVGAWYLLMRWRAIGLE